MNTNNTNLSVTATLTEAELFQRMLDASVHRALSSLSQSQDGTRTMQELLGGYLIAVCFECDMPDKVMDALRECDDPASELEIAISDLEWLMDVLKTLRREFATLRENAVVDDPAYDTPDGRPRYLPMGEGCVMAQTSLVMKMVEATRLKCRKKRNVDILIQGAPAHSGTPRRECDWPRLVGVQSELRQLRKLIQEAN